MPKGPFKGGGVYPEIYFVYYKPDYVQILHTIVIL